MHIIILNQGKKLIYNYQNNCFYFHKISALKSHYNNVFYPLPYEKLLSSTHAHQNNFKAMNSTNTNNLRNEVG